MTRLPPAGTRPSRTLALLAVLTSALSTACGGGGGGGGGTTPPAKPTIQSFGASPGAVAFGGGDVTLSWSVTGADTLSIDSGVGAVTGVEKVVHVVANTTFTLTAQNAGGDATAQTTVTVLPQNAPAIQAFTATPGGVPAGGGDVLLAWTTTDADTLTIDHGVGPVTGASKTVHVPATTTFTLTAHNSTADVTATVTVTAASYVDGAAGLDANPCTLALPCRTIAHAVSGALPGAIVYLLDGVFDPSNQTPSSLAVPDGVTIAGYHPQGPGTGALVRSVQLQFQGSGAVRDLDLDGNAEVNASATAGSPTLTLTGLRFHSTGDSGSGAAALGLGGNVAATLSPGPLSGGDCSLPALPVGSLALLAGTSKLTIQGCTFDSHGVRAGTHYLIWASQRSELTLEGVTFQNLAEIKLAHSDAVVIVGGDTPATPARLVLHGTTVKDFSLGGSNFAAVGIGSHAVVTLDGAQLTGGPNGVEADSNGVTNVALELKGTLLSNLGRPLAITLQGGPAEAVTVTGSTISNNTNGMRVYGTPTTTVNLTGLAYVGNQPSSSYDTVVQAGSVTIRNSQFTGSGGVGLIVGGSQSGGTATIDLGTAASPGGNTFTGNGLANVWFTYGGPESAVGNTWDPSNQGADASGHYADGTTVSGAQTGKNYTTVAGAALSL